MTAKRNSKNNHVYVFGSGKAHTKFDYSDVVPGYKNNMLTIIDPNVRVGKHRYVMVNCDCGKIKRVHFYNFYFGTTKSCGCLKHKTKSNLIHGKHGSRLYKIYQGIIYRCENVNSDSYCHYGGRGIKMCEEWRTDFMAFHDWAIKNNYQDSLEIDRIDVNKGYSPDNCAWADDLTQARNKRATKKIDGLTYGEHLEKLHPGYTNRIFQKFKARIKYGFSITEALDGLMESRPKNRGYLPKQRQYSQLPT